MATPLISGLFALAGVVLGASLSYFAVVWKSVAEFRVSCRLVKSELESNISLLVVTSQELDTRSNGSAPVFAGLSSDLWRVSQTNLALLLPQTEWDFLSKHYALLPHLQHEMNRVNTMQQEEISELRQSLDQQVTNMRIFRDIVGELETRGRSKLFLHAIRGRTTPAQATRQAW